jgi:hypothetical protein
VRKLLYDWKIYAHVKDQKDPTQHETILITIQMDDKKKVSVEDLITVICTKANMKNKVFDYIVQIVIKKIEIALDNFSPESEHKKSDSDNSPIGKIRKP